MANKNGLDNDGLAIRINGMLERKTINEMLEKMTTREKLGQCVMIEPCFCLKEINDDDSDEHYESITDEKFLDKLINDYHIGLFLFGGVSRIGDDTPSDWVDYFNQVNAFIEATALKMPMLYGVDAVHGVNFTKGSTIFPHNLGAVATWNTDLIRSYTEEVADELTSVGINVNFAPTVDVARDQRWGRVYESLGEDPYLASCMSEALVQGMQSNGKVAACAKHFVGYGESSNGMDRTPANLSERSLLETHLPPFKAAIKQDVLAIMVNGGDVNGTPMPASKRLMTDLLRDDMGFRGVTMSDWEDVSRLKMRHKIVETKKEAIERSFNAGLDMNMAVSDLKVVDLMEELIEEGRISLERVNEAAGNVLRLKYKLGLFDTTSLDAAAAEKMSGNAESRRLAQQIALESITLLKNDHKLLPLSKDMKSILVTGEKANTKRHLCGGWTLSWGSADEDDLNCMTVLEGIREKISIDTTITYVPSLDALSSMVISKEDYDVCISVVGEEPHSEWIGDTRTLHMEEEEFRLLNEVDAIGIPTVMVAILGRPQQMMWADQHMDAVLWAFIPGTEGAKPIADVLFGDYNPSGKLPITFPKDANQIPIAYNVRKYSCSDMNTAYEPLYPFGYGMSYTEFLYSELDVPDEVEAGKNLTVSVTVTNAGQMAGETVVQVYLEDIFASVTPLKALKAFEKISLKAGEEKRVVFEISAEALGLYDEYLNYVIEKRVIEVQIEALSKRSRLV